MPHESEIDSESSPVVPVSVVAVELALVVLCVVVTVVRRGVVAEEDAARPADRPV